LAFPFGSCESRHRAYANIFMGLDPKVDGLLTITPGVYRLFEEERQPPLSPPDIAADLATYVERLFPNLRPLCS
jgi:hypothetical protein